MSPDRDPKERVRRPRPYGSLDTSGPSTSDRIRAHVDKIVKLKKNESIYSFECRKAAVARAVELWVDAWRATEGVPSRAAMELGISPSNVPKTWLRLGLNRKRLNSLLRSHDNGSHE